MLFGSFELSKRRMNLCIIPKSMSNDYLLVSFFTNKFFECYFSLIQKYQRISHVFWVNFAVRLLKEVQQKLKTQEKSIYVML